MYPTRAPDVAGPLRRPLTPEEFKNFTNVSRETLARLETYSDLLQRWQRRINLVGRSSLGDRWRRHMLDSAQLAPLIENTATVVTDIGSGAGFPGLVLAILGVAKINLIESDSRKCAFLREAARTTDTAVAIHEGRIESIDSLRSDVVTARALAPLDRLIGYAVRHLAPGGRALFLKGKGSQQELTEAEKHWMMEVETFDSLSDPGGCVLRLGSIARAGPQRSRHRSARNTAGRQFGD